MALGCVGTGNGKTPLLGDPGVLSETSTIGEGTLNSDTGTTTGGLLSVILTKEIFMMKQKLKCFANVAGFLNVYLDLICGGENVERDISSSSFTTD